MFSDSRPVSWSKNSVIYEVNVRQYTPEGTFEAFEAHLPRLQKLGVDILWFMPIHPISIKKRNGKLGSYYAVQDYKQVNREFGTSGDFKRIVKKAHDMGFKVLLDLVANHTGWDHKWVDKNPDWYEKDSHGEIIHPQEFHWPDVAQLNYENNEMRTEMINIMKYWVEEFDIDGYRADYANGVPVDFWETARKELDKLKPMYMLAEDDKVQELLDNAFDSNYGWELTNLMIDIAAGKKTAQDVNTYLANVKNTYPEGTYPMNFITNHDMNSGNTTAELYGEAEKTMAALMFTLPGIPLLYSGQEAGLDKRLAFFEKDRIDWSDLSLQAFYERLIQLKKENEALWNGAHGGTVNILDGENTKVLVFERKKNNNNVLVIMNLTGETASTTFSTGTSSRMYTCYFTSAKVEFNQHHVHELKPWEFHIFVQ